MIRPLLTEIGLFLAPFVIYTIFLWATRAGVMHPDSWSWSIIGWLTIAALSSVILSFVVMAQLDGEAARSSYVPARVEDGKVVPGHR